MTRRSFDVIDVVEILEHWHAGRSNAHVAASVGVDRGRVRKYVEPAEAAGLFPGGPPLSRAQWVEMVGGWFPELVEAKARSLTWPAIDVHRARIGSTRKVRTTSLGMSFDPQVRHVAHGRERPRRAALVADSVAIVYQRRRGNGQP
jgi:hypothetical protein